MTELVKNQHNARPFRNIGITQILTYRLPLAGIASILHRISGAVLFLLLPFALYLFEHSLISESSFAALKRTMSCVVVKFIVLIMSWAFCFHFLAGLLRYVLLDMHIAVSRQGGKNMAAAALTLSSFVTVAVALKLFGVL